MGFDVWCGVRYLHTGLRLEHIMAMQHKLADALFERIPAGVGGTDLERVEEQGQMLHAKPRRQSEQAKQRQREEMGTAGQRQPLPGGAGGDGDVRRHDCHGLVLPDREVFARRLPSAQLPVLIGRSMGAGSYVLAGTEDSESPALSSACHGAGPAMSRHQALRTRYGRTMVKELAQRGILVRTPLQRWLHIDIFAPVPRRHESKIGECAGGDVHGRHLRHSVFSRRPSV